MYTVCRPRRRCESIKRRNRCAMSWTLNVLMLSVSPKYFTLPLWSDNAFRVRVESRRCCRVQERMIRCADGVCHATSKYGGPPYCRTEMYASPATCTPLWVTVSMPTGQSDRQTDGCQTVTLSPVHTSNYVEATFGLQHSTMLLRHCCWCGRGFRLSARRDQCSNKESCIRILLLTVTGCSVNSSPWQWANSSKTQTMTVTKEYHYEYSTRISHRRILITRCMAKPSVFLPSILLF